MEQEQPARKVDRVGEFMILGMMIGTAAAAVFSWNIGVGAGIGLCLGIVTGALAQTKK